MIKCDLTEFKVKKNVSPSSAQPLLQSQRSCPLSTVCDSPYSSYTFTNNHHCCVGLQGALSHCYSKGLSSLTSKEFIKIGRGCTEHFLHFFVTIKVFCRCQSTNLSFLSSSVLQINASGCVTITNSQPGVKSLIV